MKLDLQGNHEDCDGMCILSEMGQRSVNLEAESKIDDCKILHKSTKIMDKVIEWLQTQSDKDGSGAMQVCRGKYRKYLVTSLDYSNKGECCVKICNYLDGILDAFDEAVAKHGDV